MTVDAFQFFVFIQDKSFSLLFHFLMTARTFHVDVLTIEFKGCLIMVKINGSPVIISMTFFTIGNAPVFKLPVMHIFMTAHTDHGDFPEIFIAVDRVLILGTVTGHTILSFMSPGQHEIGLVVIKMILLPAFYHMTILTTLFRIIPGINVPCMNIFMTIHTSPTYIPETPAG